jgi:hypothetical protein
MLVDGRLPLVEDFLYRLLTAGGRRREAHAVVDGVVRPGE